MNADAVCHAVNEKRKKMRKKLEKPKNGGKNLKTKKWRKKLENKKTFNNYAKQATTEDHKKQNKTVICSVMFLRTTRCDTEVFTNYLCYNLLCF